MKYISFATFILLFNCCRKYGDAYVKGTVFESGTGLPVAGVTVYIMDDKNSGYNPYGSYQLNTLISTVTDSNGQYYISYDKKNKHRYIISVKNDDNYTAVTSPDLVNKKSIVTLEVYPKAFLKLRIKKNSTVANTLKITIGTPAKDINLDYINRQDIYDTLLPQVYTVSSNCVNYISSYIFDANYNSKQQVGQINISKNDTATFIINYD